MDERAAVPTNRQEAESLVAEAIRQAAAAGHPAARISEIAAGLVAGWPSDVRPLQSMMDRAVRYYVSEPVALPTPAPEVEVREAPRAEAGPPGGTHYPTTGTRHSASTMWTTMGLQCNDKGVALNNLSNCMTILEQWEPFHNRVWWDEFRGKLMTKTWNGRTEEWSDNHTTHLTRAIQSDVGVSRMSDDVVLKSVLAYGAQHARNEVRDFIEACEWDGENRLERFFVRCMGAADTAYTRAATKNFWISMVARVLQPGCKVDNMVILEGQQGNRKSTALRTIVGDQWHVEATADLDNKDFFQGLRGKLLVEFAELDAFQKRNTDVSTIKRVMTCNIDTYRPPYGKFPVDVPRTSIFVGTTNESAYLRDSTGARRFWPIVCPGEINIEEIKRQRLQCFAEARLRYRSGESWWEMPAEETRREQESRRQADEWEAIVERTLGMRQGGVTIRALLCDAFSIGVAEQDQATQQRCAKILRAMGWQSHVVWTDGKAEREWRRG